DPRRASWRNPDAPSEDERGVEHGPRRTAKGQAVGDALRRARIAAASEDLGPIRAKLRPADRLAFEHGQMTSPDFGFMRRTTPARCEKRPNGRQVFGLHEQLRKRR